MLIFACVVFGLIGLYGLLVLGLYIWVDSLSFHELVMLGMYMEYGEGLNDPDWDDWDDDYTN